MARRGKKHHDEHGEGEAWLLPYSDLMTLLLALFIALFAASQTDESKAAEMSAAFQSIFGSGTGNIASSGSDGILPNSSSIVDSITPPGESSDEREATGDTSTPMFSPEDLGNLQMVQGDLESYFVHEDLQGEATTHIDERGLVITLTNTLLFDSGSAEIKDASIEALIEVGKMANELDNYIRIEGHTDSNPIRTAVYPSNWELSGARASRVVRLLIERAGISKEKLSAVGYADTNPIGDNSTAEGRAQNRRVEIIILNMKYSTLENQVEDIDRID